MKRVCQKTDECEHYLRLQEFIENTKAPITGDIPFDCCKEYNYKLEQEIYAQQEQRKLQNDTIDQLNQELEQSEQVRKHWVKIKDEYKQELERYRSSYNFTQHIKSHLKDGEYVICKICGKSLKQFEEGD